MAKKDNTKAPSINVVAPKGFLGPILITPHYEHVDHPDGQRYEIVGRLPSVDGLPGEICFPATRQLVFAEGVEISVYYQILKPSTERSPGKAQVMLTNPYEVGPEIFLPHDEYLKACREEIEFRRGVNKRGQKVWKGFDRNGRYTEAHPRARINPNGKTLVIVQERGKMNMAFTPRPQKVGTGKELAVCEAVQNGIVSLNDLAHIIRERYTAKLGTKGDKPEDIVCTKRYVNVFSLLKVDPNTVDEAGINAAFRKMTTLFHTDTNLRNVSRETSAGKAIDADFVAYNKSREAALAYIKVRDEMIATAQERAAEERETAAMQLTDEDRRVNERSELAYNVLLSHLTGRTTADDLKPAAIECLSDAVVWLTDDCEGERADVVTLVACGLANVGTPSELRTKFSTNQAYDKAVKRGETALADAERQLNS